MSLIGDIHIYAANQRAQERQRRLAADLASEQRRKFNEVMSISQNSHWRGASVPCGLVNVAPTCNCRNCGAPFGFEEKQCSYCRSKR